MAEKCDRNINQIDRKEERTMTVSELYRQIDTWYSQNLSCEWDHDGVMCMPRPDREVKKILLSLDATKEAVKEAIDGNYDAIITHHPMLFSPLYGISQQDGVGALICDLIEHQISVFSFHTRMDAGEHGVNDALAEKIGLCDIETVANFIRVGSFSKPLPFDKAIKKIKKSLAAQSCKCVAVKKDMPILRVAVCGGEGKDFLPDAISANADLYLTGSLSYHTLNSISPSPIPLMIAGHYETEAPILPILKDRILEILPSAQIDIFECNRVITI
jgi:dinuclear metal center YbgI/SA1388 family protein